MQNKRRWYVSFRHNHTVFKLYFIFAVKINKRYRNFPVAEHWKSIFFPKKSIWLNALLNLHKEIICGALIHSKKNVFHKSNFFCWVVFMLYLSYIMELYFYLWKYNTNLYYCKLIIMYLDFLSFFQKKKKKILPNSGITWIMDV